MVDVIPGIGLGGSDLGDLVKKIALVAPSVEWVQIDIADETLVPAKTVTDFTGLGDALKTVGVDTTKLSLEAHLMVADPIKYIKPLADAGFKRLIAHVECSDPRQFLEEAKYESVEVGLAIDGPTEFEQIEPFLDAIDVVLVMTIEAGASGQPFLPETVEKVKTIHQNLPDLPIEVDGGINDQTAGIVREAGATRIVSTSYLFKDPSTIAEAIAHLNGNLQSASS